MQPSVGWIVHYVSYGTPGGEYGKKCRAAVVTGLGEMLEYPVHGDGIDDPGPDDAQLADLCVLNPTGMFFNQGVPYQDGAETAGAPDCPQRERHGQPHRYCACGWVEASHRGGTWHWPERAGQPAVPTPGSA